MDQLDEFLKKLGLKYENLNSEERDTYTSWLKALQQGNLTTERVKEYISSLRSNVENQLTRFDVGKNEDIYLKARLRNLILIEAMMATPERAKRALEQALANNLK